MVLLVERFSRFCSKLENHLHSSNNRPDGAAEEEEDALLVSALKEFESSVSTLVNQLCLNPKPTSEILSLPWIHDCFEVLSMVNREFSRLAVGIDYPTSKWTSASVEDYLKCSLSFLDHLNSISASLSFLSQERICLFHALTLVEGSPGSAIEGLKAIKLKTSSKKFKIEEADMEVVVDREQTSNNPTKEWVISQALMEVNRVGFVVCGVVLAGLSGDERFYLERRDLIGNFTNLDSTIRGAVMERGVTLKEIKELNDGVVSLTAAIAEGEETRNAAEEMKIRLKSFENLVDGLVKKVDSVFSEVFAERNAVLDHVRFKKL